MILNKHQMNGWAAMLQHYFLTAIVPESDKKIMFIKQTEKVMETYSIGIVGQTKILQVEERLPSIIKFILDLKFKANLLKLIQIFIWRLIMVFYGG